MKQFFNKNTIKYFFDSNSHSNSGLTMIELLVVLAIVGVLAILFFFGMRGQIEKGRDAKRKDDLEKIKISYEDYYSDNDCYPPENALDPTHPDSAELDNYLREIPVDPLTSDPYVYIPMPNVCPGYKILTKLEYEDDPSILKVGCGPTACGANGVYLENNYGVAVGTQVPEDGYIFDPPGEGSSPSSRYVFDSNQTCVAIEKPGEDNCSNSPVFSTMAECFVQREICYDKCDRCTNE